MKKEDHDVLQVTRIKCRKTELVSDHEKLMSQVRRSRSNRKRRRNRV